MYGIKQNFDGKAKSMWITDNWCLVSAPTDAGRLNTIVLNAVVSRKIHIIVTVLKKLGPKATRSTMDPESWTHACARTNTLTHTHTHTHIHRWARWIHLSKSTLMIGKKWTGLVLNVPCDRWLTTFLQGFDINNQHCLTTSTHHLSHELFNYCSVV